LNVRVVLFHDLITGPGLIPYC